MDFHGERRIDILLELRKKEEKNKRAEVWMCVCVCVFVSVASFETPKILCELGA